MQKPQTETAQATPTLIHALISNLPGGAAFVVDRNLRYLLAQGEALAIAGFKPEDFVGRTIFEVLSADLAASYEPMYRQALAGEPFEHEHNAHNRSYISRGTPLRAEDGEIYAVLVVSYDISERLAALRERVRAEDERKRTEAALRESEEKYRSLFNSINEGFCVIELIDDDAERAVDYRFLEVNPTFERLTGVKNVIGKTDKELNINTEAHWLENYDRVARTGEPRHLENYHAATEHWYQAYVSRVGGEGSRQVAIIFDDISDRKRAEEALREGEEQQAFLLKFSDALRAEPDADSVANRAVRMLAEHLHLDRVWLSEVFEQQGISTVGPEYHRPDLPSMSGVFRLSDYPETMRQLVTQPMVIHDVTNDPGFSDSEKALLPQLHIQALLVVSLRKGQHQVIWALAAAMTTPRHWSESERVLLEQVSERIWAAIERAKAEAAMRSSELQRIREQSAREEERQRAESLAELDRAKTLFFTHVSHEFRTPLTLSLAPLSDALSDRTHPLDPVHRERLELVHRNSLRLLKLVNTLLDFSRIEAGRIKAVYEPTDLAMFTTELASVFRSTIEQAGLRLVVDCPPLPEPVYVDREMWEKIVLNLLSNAFKFTFTGEIVVRMRPAGEQVILQIRDTGTGIAPEHLPHLFERFYQVRGVQARTYAGSGIGLALVHELIRLHGGTIEVTSILRKGTCIELAIPFGTEHLPHERIQAARTLTSTAKASIPYVEEAERWIPEADFRLPILNFELGNKDTQWQNSYSEEQTNNLKSSLAKVGIVTGTAKTPTSRKIPNPKFKVLLVDDNADMRQYLTRILSEHVQVEAVADGVSALAAAQAQVPDLILSDVRMPGLDGFELLKALRNDPHTREVSIILLSARAGEEAVIEGLESGADDYLIKPFSAQELISRVNAHLQMAQLRNQALHQERTISRRKDELLSTVSHELNTPLVAILGWTRLLRGNPPNPSMLMRALETIERNATLQAKLIQDLLDISRITAGKLRLKLEPVELSLVIEMTIAAVETAAIAKNINLTWSEASAQLTEPEIASIKVLGDRDRLQQIFSNILTNAIKFTPESGFINVELSVLKVKRVAYAEVRVTDNGVGIAADFLPHVFERFRQVENSGSAKGLGLGLAIAQHLVELHNGTIHAQSAGVGQGATFIVRLPLLRE